MDKELNKKQDDYYANEGAALFIKGKMVFGIHPNNLENNFQNLATGKMKINWESLLENNIKKQKRGR